MIVDCAVHENGVRREGTLALEDAYEAGREPNAFVWIGLSSPPRRSSIRSDASSGSTTWRSKTRSTDQKTVCFLSFSERLADCPPNAVGAENPITADEQVNAIR
jgi:hypothetical protein